MWTLPRKPASLPSGYSFRLVDRRLLATLLNEPNKAVATALVLQDTAQALRKRIHAGHFYTKEELHRTRVAAATAVAALRALRVNDPDVHDAADALACFLRDEDYPPRALGMGASP